MFLFLMGIGFQEILLVLIFWAVVFVGLFNILKKRLRAQSTWVHVLLSMAGATILSPLILSGLAMLLYWIFTEG